MYHIPDINDYRREVDEFVKELENKRMKDDLENNGSVNSVLENENYDDGDQKQTKKRKSFDPTICFTFFGTWMESIHQIKKLNGAESALDFLFAIADYAMFDEEPEFPDASILNVVWPGISRDIDNSVKRRKSQFDKDELNENQQRAKEALIEYPEMSHRKIAAMLGVSASTIDRAERKYKEEIEAAREANNATVVTSSDFNYFSDTDADSANDTVTRCSDADEPDIDYLDEEENDVSKSKELDPDLYNGKRWDELTYEEQMRACIEYDKEHGIDMSSYEGNYDDYPF